MIAFLTLELRIEGAHSLKDKRQVLRSLKDRLRSHFNVAVAELDHTDLWQRATVGVVSISDSRDYLDGLMHNVERQSMRIANNAGAEVADSFLEYL
ncbi:MAG TPA: DUF503 domain-containing protein [Terriglobales bacterium]|jgi:uncharacterized protein|nr:DUF503 domain-containing protein [Terriglobales bacterium]HKT68284.1 DUF503 domain-containing protein [Terriglobales bacterium]HKW66961.1 DUF503 domain-containing protein [Terriglobales bacterium]